MTILLYLFSYEMSRKQGSVPEETTPVVRNKPADTVARLKLQAMRRKLLRPLEFSLSATNAFVVWVGLCNGPGAIEQLFLYAKWMTFSPALVAFKLLF